MHIPRLIRHDDIRKRLGIRLAGTREVPFAVHPGFYLGVVAVRMGPERGIDLTGRNHRGQEGGTCQSSITAKILLILFEYGYVVIRFFVHNF